MIGSMKGFVVNQVNPKFKEYNKPFALAIVVGIPTLGLTFALFMRMFTQCTESVYTAGMSGGLEVLLGQSDCVHEAMRAQIQGTYLGFKPCNLPGVNYCEEEGTTMYKNADVCLNEGLFMGKAKVCPAMLATVGAALGYAGFIELLITVVCVFCFLQCGILRGGPNGYMGMMIKTIMAQKDTGKAIGSEVMGA
jgi:hypothetical protein